MTPRGVRLKCLANWLLWLIDDRKIVSGDTENKYKFDYPSDSEWTVDSIEQRIKELSADYDIPAEVVKVPEGLTGDAAVRSMLGQLLVFAKKMDNPDSTITVDSPALQHQVAEMMEDGRPNPEMLQKWKTLYEQTYTYDEPLKAGRNHMTYRELISAIVSSELQFRNFTHW